MFFLMLNYWLENANQTVSQIEMKVNVGGMIEMNKKYRQSSVMCSIKNLHTIYKK